MILRVYTAFSRAVKHVTGRDAQYAEKGVEGHRWLCGRRATWNTRGILLRSAIKLPTSQARCATRRRGAAEAPVSGLFERSAADERRIASGLAQADLAIQLRGKDFGPKVGLARGVTRLSDDAVSAKHVSSLRTDYRPTRELMAAHRS